MATYTTEGLNLEQRRVLALLPEEERPAFAADARASNLPGRTARCGCGRTAPSDNPYLAFLEYRGPGSRYEAEHCAQCGYAPIAHERFSGRLRDVVRPGVWPRGVAPHEFTQGGPHEFDTFYCGHGGWD